MRPREITDIVASKRASDGAGVKINRLVGFNGARRMDPFLMLDEIRADSRADFAGGFPPHPHRGFETVTYLLAGRMRHKDNSGHEGVIAPGGVQWMTAGRGIIHSEMPEQENGLLMGFQLWVNLPRSAKMTAPAYQEFPADHTAVEEWETGTRIRVIAGRTERGTEGPVHNHYVDPIYMDIQLQPGDELFQSLSEKHNAFIYVIEGDVQIGEQRRAVDRRTLAVLSSGDQVRISADNNSRFLLVAGRPLNEPVVRGGPFVMNSKAEVLQDFEDFQNTRF